MISFSARFLSLLPIFLQFVRDKETENEVTYHERKNDRKRERNETIALRRIQWFSSSRPFTYMHPDARQIENLNPRVSLISQSLLKFWTACLFVQKLNARRVWNFERLRIQWFGRNSQVSEVDSKVQKRGEFENRDVSESPMFGRFEISTFEMHTWELEASNVQVFDASNIRAVRKFEISHVWTFEGFSFVSERM